MGKMMKKAGAAVIAVTLATSLVACGSKGDDDVKDKVNKANEQVQNEEQELFSFRKEDAGAVLIKYNGDDEEVEIPKEYDGLAVVQIENGAFGDGKEIVKVTIPDSVTQIDNNAFPETWEFTVEAYEGTYAEYYAYNWGRAFESLGEWGAQASKLAIWNKEGSYCEILSLGKEPKEDWLEGVSFVTENGKSVLRLDNCDIGQIEQHWTGDLTIELADGSKNYVTGARGMEGIQVHGNLTITGNGDISISGSDLTSGREGGAYVGFGVLVVGNLTIKDGVQMFAKGGKSKGQIAEGVYIHNGTLTISGSRLEAQAGESSMAVSAIRVNKREDDTDSESSEIVLDKVKIAEGGDLTPIHFVGYYEGSDEQYDEQFGVGFSSTGSIIYNDEEEMGFEGASSYVRIEPDATANQ